MPSELTNDQIALLCDIGELPMSKITGDQARELEWLVSSGYLNHDGAGGAFQLTAKAVEFLGKRGVGLNEA